MISPSKNKFLNRIIIIFLIHFIVKIGDQSFNVFSDFTYRGLLFSVYFFTYWIIVWYIASFFNQKIKLKLDVSSKNKISYTYLLFLFHFIFGLLVSFGLNISYRLGDIILFNRSIVWEDIPIANPELTVSLSMIYMIIFTFDIYHESSIKTKEDQIQLAKLKQENTLAQYLNLKSQIEPHFLFNSLSVLSSIIHSDVNLASEFVLRLSKILRYVIEKNEFVLVPLREEISFLEDYFFLIQNRFQDGIILNNTIDKDIMDSCYIPPSSLQLLVENAIKHNKFTKDNPLLINLYNNEENLIVSNILHVRDDMKNSTKSGLQNLSGRFKHFSSNSIEIKKTDTNFIVSLPILTKLHDERFNI